MKETLHYKGHRWTNEEIKSLMKFWVEEKTLTEIATELKVTQTALLKQIQRLRKNGIPLPRRRNGHITGVRNRNWTHGETEYLLRRRNEKATSEEIGAELGRTTNAVDGMIQQLRKENVGVAMRGCGVRRLWDAEGLKGVLLNQSLQ